MRRAVFVFPCLLVLLGCSAVSAGPAGTPDKQIVPAEVQDLALFHTGALELQVLSGAFASFQPTHDARPNFNYELTALRLGYMLDTPRSTGFFRGNDELILESSGAVIFQGPGTAIGGLSVHIRRNFVQPGWWAVPYFGIMAGGVYTDIYHNRTERAIGKQFDFNLGGNLGVRLLLPHSAWSVDAECAYRHISDAGITARNDGIDGLGIMLGLSRFF